MRGSRQSYTFPPDDEWNAMTSAERDAAAAGWFEAQAARDAAGQLRAITGDVSEEDREFMGGDPDTW